MPEFFLDFFLDFLQDFLHDKKTCIYSRKKVGKKSEKKSRKSPAKGLAKSLAKNLEMSRMSDYWQNFLCETISRLLLENSSISPTAEVKVKNAQNHRRIDAQGKAEGIKPVIYGILYYPNKVGILLYCSPGPQSGIFVPRSVSESSHFGP